MRLSRMQKKTWERVKEEKEAEKTRRKRSGLPVSDVRKKAKTRAKKANRKRASASVWVVPGGLPGLGKR